MMEPQNERLALREAYDAIRFPATDEHPDRRSTVVLSLAVLAESVGRENWRDMELRAYNYLISPPPMWPERGLGKGVMAESVFRLARTMSKVRRSFSLGRHAVARREEA
jgi:hypothetical protein